MIHVPRLNGPLVEEHGWTLPSVRNMISSPAAVCKGAQGVNATAICLHSLKPLLLTGKGPVPHEPSVKVSPDEPNVVEKRGYCHSELRHSLVMYSSVLQEAVSYPTLLLLCIAPAVAGRK